MDPWQWIETELLRLDQAGLLRHRQVRQSCQQAHIRLGEKWLVNFSSNDYLGLAAPLGRYAAQLVEEGWGSGASGLISGYSSAHQELEHLLAEWEQAEAALVFSSGYAANTGMISALAGRGDVVLSDERNHASIIDGCRLSRAEVRIYRHADPEHLEEQLKTAGGYRRRLIVSDSVFSMDGDVAPLEAIAELAERYGAMVLIDEAHATGVFGTEGRGAVHRAGLNERLKVRVGTLSKALGGIGGFVVGPERVIQWAVQRARSYFFSTALPDLAVRIACRAVSWVRQAEPARQHLWQLAARLRSGLQQMGWDLGRSSSQIVPVLIGDPATTMDYAQRLRHAGFLVPGIRPPSVPPGESLLRISLSAAHSHKDIDRLLEAMSRLEVPVRPT
ncbi:MAG: 8-amino-7-oxononanoate synthase [Pirellulaceae bacterium]|nr:MAG: 8-amino-7-oxononanoate synthase [Pirellulaceae bacterium]